jgi:hypothetical protein
MLIKDNLVFISKLKKIKPYYSSYSIKESAKGCKINAIRYKILLPALMALSPQIMPFIPF